MLNEGVDFGHTHQEGAAEVRRFDELAAAVLHCLWSLLHIF
jgi:hypothetical protein